MFAGNSIVYGHLHGSGHNMPVVDMPLTMALHLASYRLPVYSKGEWLKEMG